MSDPSVFVVHATGAPLLGLRLPLPFVPRSKSEIANTMSVHFLGALGGGGVGLVWSGLGRSALAFACPCLQRPTSVHDNKADDKNVAVNDNDDYDDDDVEEKKKMKKKNKKMMMIRLQWPRFS